MTGFTKIYKHELYTSTIHNLKALEVHKYSKSYKMNFNYLIWMKVTKLKIKSVQTAEKILEFPREREGETTFVNCDDSNTTHHNELLPHFKGFWILIIIWKETYHWNTLVTDCLITHITQTWMIPRVYMMMHLQIPCVNKCFITYIIAFCNTDVPSGYLCHGVLYYTLHSDMYALQDVNVHVPSDYFCVWMYYYTHHTDKNATQYVHADGPSGYVCH